MFASSAVVAGTVPGAWRCSVTMFANVMFVAGAGRDQGRTRVAPNARTVTDGHEVLCYLPRTVGLTSACRSLITAFANSATLACAAREQ